MRDYANTSNIYHINSASSISDIDQYHQRMTNKAALSHQNHQRNFNLTDDPRNSCDYHPNAYGKKVNIVENRHGGASFLSSSPLPPPESIPTTSSSTTVVSRMQRPTKTTCDDQANCYSLIGALTSAMVRGACGNTVQPIQDDIITSDCEAPSNYNGNNNNSNSSHNNDDSHRAHHNSLNQYSQRKSITQTSSINSYTTYGNDNYKHNYMLWIVTPVAAR